MMVYDRDLKWINRIIWALQAVNAFSGIASIFFHQWGNACGYLIWSTNIWTWRRMIRNTQRQRDRNREIEAAMLKVLAGDRY